MTRDGWLAAHPYLQPVADLHALVEAAVAEAFIPVAPIPNWEDYADDFRAGVPLLHSSNAAIDLGRLEDAVHSLIQKLASSPARTLAEQCQILEAELRGVRAAERRRGRSRDVGFVLADAPRAVSLPGVGWSWLVT